MIVQAPSEGRYLHVHGRVLLNALWHTTASMLLQLAVRGKHCSPLAGTPTRGAKHGC